MGHTKIIAVFFPLLLFVTSQSANAALFYGACPSGTVGTPLGTGFISGSSGSCGGTSNSGGGFSPSMAKGARPVYDCAASGYQTTTNTLQIERTTFSSVSQHIMQKVVREYASGFSLNRGAASSDSNSYKPDTFWGDTNISSLTEHNNKIPGEATNIYQFTGGLDKRQGDLSYGAALTYAYTNSNQVCDNNSTVNTVGITPYLAYKINDYLFASGLGSYFYSNTSGVAGANEINTHDYQTEVNLNAFKVIGSFILKGRVGMRYKHTNSSQKGAAAGRDNTFDEITGIVDGQVDYRFDNGFTLFAGALYNHDAREDSGASSLIRGNNIIWARYGAEYPVRNGFLVGAKIENDVNDTHVNYLTGSVNMRLEL